ncbi:MAG: hypothetical protein ACJ8F7_18100 [Gemmataceae bacterium]
MAGGWYVLLERDLPGVEVSTDGGRALLYFHHHIDELAARLELPLLSGFFCPDRAGVLDYLRAQGVEPDPEMLPEEEWFEPADGLLTVRRLLGHLRDEPAALPSRDKIAADLEEVERILTPADRDGVRFRLSRKLPPAPEPE